MTKQKSVYTTGERQTERQIERELKALANRRRLAIIRYPASVKEANVSDIAGEIKLSFKSTSRHLAVLISADILEKEQRGLEVHHRLASRRSPIVRQMLELLRN